MPAPLSTTGASSESHAWQELEEVFAALGQLARSSAAPTEFYRTLLDQSVRAISALGGVVWLRTDHGPLQSVAQVGWPRDRFTGDDVRRAHEAMLVDVAASGQVVSINPHSKTGTGDSANPTNQLLLVAPVVVETQAAEHRTARAIIELLIRADASPATHRGCEQFLTAVCELAADYHAFNDLQRLRSSDEYHNQLLALSQNTHRQLNLAETAYAVANEGRGLVVCDRLTVLIDRGRRCRMLAASGVSRIERRSSAARRLSRVAELVRNTDEAAFYADGTADALPPVAEALELHAEESHARQIAAIPLRAPAKNARSDDDLAAKRKSLKRERPRFVLIAEQFDARGLNRDRLADVADTCATALYNAWEYDRLPFSWLLRPLAAAKQQVVEHVPRTLFIVAAALSAIAALVFVQSDFEIESDGTLQPIVWRDVFAPRNGLVDEVLVVHGATVEKGEPLVRMRDPELELEIKRVDGELETARRQLDAVQATRTNRAVRENNPTDSYRLSTEERELQQRLANLRLELDLLQQERKQLVVTAPIAGRVLTWDIAHRLGARPVERGESLVTVADLNDQWQLELNVPDDRIGYVLAAQQKMQTDLPVEFRLTSDDREQHSGHIAEVCQTANVERENGESPTPTVLVKVALDKLALSDQSRRELRPGVSARAKIACGRAPVGYVWFHDVWDNVVEWLTF